MSRTSSSVRRECLLPDSKELAEASWAFSSLASMSKKGEALASDSQL